MSLILMCVFDVRIIGMYKRKFIKTRHLSIRLQFQGDQSPTRLHPIRPMADAHTRAEELWLGEINFSNVGDAFCCCRVGCELLGWFLLQKLFGRDDFWRWCLLILLWGWWYYGVMWCCFFFRWMKSSGVGAAYILQRFWTPNSTQHFRVFLPLPPITPCFNQC